MGTQPNREHAALIADAYDQMAALLAQDPQRARMVTGEAVRTYDVAVLVEAAKRMRAGA